MTRVLPMEYFCSNCRQLRLYLKDNNKPTACGYCGSGELLVARVGTLDKEACLATFPPPEAK